MYAMFNGQPIFGPRGPQGPDGNPIGTIISYMGLTAPKDYLICDGTEYNLADYPELASFFTRQFGNANYFGGDGTATFAVPDMRNLFLRGYHGEATEQLSGGVGIKQDATAHPYTVILEGGLYMYTIKPRNEDSKGKNDEFGFRTDGYTMGNGASTYTSRPVNMAVLYCIKATESVPSENVYSAEETRIGTWIDGKPLYRRIFQFSLPSPGHDILIPNTEIPNVDEIVEMSASIKRIGSSITYPYPFAYAQDVATTFYVVGKGILVDITSGFNYFAGSKVTEAVTYTKTTDPTPTILLTSEVKLPQSVTLSTQDTGLDSPVTVTFPNNVTVASASASSTKFKL